MKNALRIVIVLVLLGLVVTAWQMGWLGLLSLDVLKSKLDSLKTLLAANPLQSLLLFFAAYVAVTALSLPGAVIMTLAAGALFGLLQGTLLVSFASTLGATLAFLSSRFVFREAVEKRFASQLKGFNAGIEKDGARYLFALRLVPLFPFFVVNLAMGLTRIKTLTFAWVSQIGMLVGTIVYVNAGTQLAKVDELSGLLSPALIGSLVLLAALPFALKVITEALANRRLYRRWQKPKRFDRNLLVIGAGAGGLVSSYIAAAVKAKVTLIERGHMGGDCLNYGCVPSKALIRSAKFAHDARHGAKLGFTDQVPLFDFKEVMDRVARVIATIAPHDSVERYSGLGVECIQGSAKVLSPWEVEVNGKRLTAPNLIIAAGASPLIPPIPGLSECAPLSSETLWEIRELPRSLLILGGGPIGCELAQAFARLGSKVTLVQLGPRILPREDDDVAELITRTLSAEGVTVLTSTSIERFESGSAYFQILGVEQRIAFDRVLCAVGRKPNTKGYGLEELGLEINANGTIKTDPWLRTSLPNIFAVGDIAGPYQFTHAAAHQAWYAAVHALFGRFKKFKVDYSALPWATFTAPAVARVGLNETDATAQGVAFEVTRYGIDDLDRAICDEAAEGFIKVLTAKGSDRILGATIVCEHAAELIPEFVTAIKNKIGLNKILGTIHLYPSWAEANKYVAGQWKQANKPERLLRWVERYHTWARG